MIDFHNHIIPGIDDGSPDSETSLNLIKGLQDLGFTEFIFTPHIIADTHPNSPESIKQGFDVLNAVIDQNNVDLKRSFAAEYMMDDIFSQKLRNKEPFLKLVDDKILVEFSYIQRPDHVEKISFDLQIQGYEPYALDELVHTFNEDEIITGSGSVPEIWYDDDEGLKHRHFVDIFIPSQNKCIEVKSTWTAEKKKDNIFKKQQAGKQLGYNYEIWIYNSKGEKVGCIV
jgi:hypothetical protein